MKKYCETCGECTDHYVVTKQKPSSYGKTRLEKFKAFLDGLISGWAGHGLAALDLMDRYIVCKKCNTEIKEK